MVINYHNYNFKGIIDNCDFSHNRAALWQTDYSDDVFHTFLGLYSVNYLVVNGTVTTSLPVFIQNILKLFSKDELSFYGFGTTWG